ncbi:MAG: hypothetical protein IK050_01780, partial [Lachnospiraceae bacterium]|nr:hypothetical protein [Lachnospiraceae bacterium]
IAFLIKDKYNLLSINVSKDNLDEGSLPKLIDTLGKVETFYAINKNKIDVDAIEDEMERNENLTEYEKFTKTIEFIEKMARERLGLVFGNEIIFKEEK